MSALLLITTCIGIEDSRRGSCCWERHRQTSRLVRILILLNAALKLWTRLQSSVPERKKSRTGRAVASTTSQRHVSSPTLDALGEHSNGAGIGKSGKHKGSRMKGGVFLGPVRVLLQEIVTTAEAVRMQKCRVDHRGPFSCSVCCTAHALPFRVREKMVQYCRHRTHEVPRLCLTFATQHVP